MNELSPEAKRLLLILESFDSAVALHSADGTMIYLNNLAMDLYGITDKERFISLNPNFYRSPGYRDSLNPMDIKVNDLEVNVLFDFDLFNANFQNISNKKGRVYHFLRIHPIFSENGELEYVMTFGKDVTDEHEQKTIENRLMESLPFLFSTVGVSIWTLDLKTGKRIFGIGAHFFPHIKTLSDCLNCIRRSDVPLLNNAIALIQYGGKMEEHFIVHINNISKNKKEITLDVTCTPQIENGKVIAINFLTIDITHKEKIQLEIITKDKKLSMSMDKLESTNQLLFSLIDKMPCLFFAKDVDNDFKYVMANSLFCKKIGKRSFDIIGKSDKELISNQEEANNYRQNDIQTIFKKTISIREETNWDGVHRVWQTSKYFLETNDGRRLVIGLSQDITSLDTAYQELKNAKEASERSDNLKIAHLRPSS